MNRVGTGLLGGSFSSRYSPSTRTGGFVIVKAIFIASLVLLVVESLLWTFLEYNLFDRVTFGTSPDLVIALWWLSLIGLTFVCLVGMIAAFKEHFWTSVLFVFLMMAAIVAGNLNPFVRFNPVTNVTCTAVAMIGLTFAVYISSEDRDVRYSG